MTYDNFCVKKIDVQDYNVLNDNGVRPIIWEVRMTATFNKECRIGQ